MARPQHRRATCRSHARVLMPRGKERPLTEVGPQEQSIWGLPDVSRVPVAKHPCFGRYFWTLFEAVGRDLMTSFDRPRAESSPALTLKLVAANTTATIPTDHASGFTLIVKPPWVVFRHAITPVK